MKRLYLINGKAGSGKDIFVNMVEAILYGHVHNDITLANLHASDRAKRALIYVGWDGVRTEEARKTLVELVKYGQTRNVSEKIITENAVCNDSDVVFFHERDPKQFARLITLYPFTKTILLRRPGAPDLEEDIWGIENYEYDFIIINDGTLGDLEKRAARFVSEEAILHE